MKKSILSAIIGLAVSATSSFGLGVIMIDNYDSFNGNGGPLVTYGPGAGILTGQGLGPGWTAGLYFAQGDTRSSIMSDPSGYADPSTLGGGLTLGTGPGSTAAFFSSTLIFGEFLAGTSFAINDSPGDTVTLMIVAYTGFSYSTSLNRGHSDAFIMTTSLITDPNAHKVGDYMPGFSVPVPEPATLALGGMALAVLIAVRRTKV
jgi:PEP-CTERM motif